MAARASSHAFPDDGQPSPTGGVVKANFVFYTDFPATSSVKVVGSLPELGNWNVEHGLPLHFEAASRAFVGSTVVGISRTFDPVILVHHNHVVNTIVAASADPASASVEFEYKIAVLVAHSTTTTADSWKWQPGPNRRATLVKKSPDVSATAAKLSAVALRNSEPALHILRETWYPSRDGTQVIASDGYLEPHRTQLQDRYKAFEAALGVIDAHCEGLDKFSRGWEYFGFNREVQAGSAGIIFREWAPGATAASLVGEFNDWDVTANVCKKDSFVQGVFACFLPDLPDGTSAIRHNTLVKVSFVKPGGERIYRIPAWIRYAIYQKETNEYCGKYWNPPMEDRYEWKHPRLRTACTADYVSTSGIESLSSQTDWVGKSPSHASVPGIKAQSVTATEQSADPAAAGLRIYEAHVGMSSRDEKVSSYVEFADTVLPRIKGLGYNCVQLMAIMEHAYYGSFGYHVTSFLAASSRFGTPEQLKYLVDKAHSMGLLIIMDLVHSHAAKNVNDGINMFDGTDYQYFHAGEKGNHPLWDSRLFDYSKLEVQRFLLSSARLFIEEYRFDGYRFDGITSMMYLHHGMSYGFSGGYHEYFGENTDQSAVVYLMLANHMLHTCSPPALSIAEDVSGMPTLCCPVPDGGVGFDYRLAMAIPDKWIKTLKEVRDDDWDLGSIVFTLTNRRWQEKTIAYAESHDQALVGDKTLAFWLMDKEMYWHMSVLEKPIHPVVDRGLALHKMIRLITYALGGDAYLNFMGNEFGHPEWIDFPRIGNDWSYKHCRRQWNLADDPLLNYKHLNTFDAAMHHLEDAYPWLISHGSYVSLKHESDKLVVFDRDTKNGPLLFVFNFHPTNSFPDYKIGAPCSGEWEIALDSDWEEFAGHSRVDRSCTFFTNNDPWHGRPCSLQIYSPCRTVIVLKLRK